MMYPLLFMLIIHGCAAMPYFGSPYLRAYGFPGAGFDSWPGSFPSFSTFPRFNSDMFSAPTFPTFAQPMMPMMPPMPPMPAFPIIPTPSENAECQEVPDVKDLPFPAHSEIPTSTLKPEEILKNEVTKTTYLCKDNNKKEFYILRTHAVFTTGNIRNIQDTANYYSLEKSPLTIDKDLSINENKIWEKLDKLDLEKEREKQRQTAIQHPFGLHPFWSPLWSPFTFSRPECVDHEYLSALDYPKVDVSPTSLGDEIVSKDISHETQLCTDKTTNKKFYSLKTLVSAKTKNGHVINRSSTLSHMADSDGKPLPRADGATSVVSNTISSVTNGIPKSESTYVTYHHT